MLRKLFKWKKENREEKKENLGGTMKKSGFNKAEFIEKVEKAVRRLYRKELKEANHRIFYLKESV